MNLDDLDDVLGYKVVRRWDYCYVITNNRDGLPYAAFSMRELAEEALSGYIKEAVKRERAKHNKKLSLISDKMAEVDRSIAELMGAADRTPLRANDVNWLAGWRAALKWVWAL